jgi:hypothetical protein
MAWCQCIQPYAASELKYLAEAGFLLENASNKSQPSERISVEEDNFSFKNLAAIRAGLHV